MKTAVVLFLISLAAGAEECFEIDGARSEMSFEIAQAGTPFSGEIEKRGGEVCVADGAIIRIAAWLEPASIRTGLPELDAALVGDEFFAVAKHPRATFSSNDIEASGGKYIAHGRLEMKGIGRDFDLPFELEKTPAGYRAAGETSLRRLEFDIGTGEWADTEWLSDDVTVRFTIITK